MFMQPAPPTPQNMSRPFVVGLVMLLLFLSMQADWGAPRPAGKRGERGQAASPQPELPTTHEKIIYDLSLSNDRLERENWQMKQHILDLRRAMRRDGCQLNGTLYTFPDLEHWLQAANDTQRLHFDRHRPRHHIEPRQEAAAAADAEREQAQAQPAETLSAAQQEARHSLRGSSSSSRGGGDASRQPP